MYFDKEENRHVRISRKDIQKRFGKDITTKDEADFIVKILDAEYESLRTRLERRVTWEKEFYNFSDLLEAYTKNQKRHAPNSYENNVHYLKHYVLHYFLAISRCNNIDQWPELYEGFKDWLENKACLVKQPEKIISYGSKNHCIKALNTFMRHLYRTKIISHLVLCEKFPQFKLNERSIDDVIDESDMNKVWASLRASHHALEATFFRLLFFTGLRFNEAMGLSLYDIHEGEVQHKALKRLLEQHNIAQYGYLVLSSQPDHKSRGLRTPLGNINRKPLKGKKQISEKCRE